MNHNPLSLIQQHHRVAVISHVNPDGDSLGATLGLGLALKALCNEVYMYINDKFPSKYSFLPSWQHLANYDLKDRIDFDFCFVLDCGDPTRLGYSQLIFKKSHKVVNIDHHISNTKFGNINIVDSKVSSTCEIIYCLLKDLDIRLNTDIATCLYTGITTDTGNFIYDNTTANTHKVISELMAYNIDLNEISYGLYQNKSLNSIKFLGYVLNNMEISLGGKLATITVTRELIKEFNIDFSEVDGVINYARDIQGVEIAIMLKEVSDNEVKIGFRSKNKIDVSKLAQKFGGGGHKKAAGATYYGSIKEIRSEIEDQIRLDLGW